MEKRFAPASFEQKWQRYWSEGEYFRCPTGDAAKGRKSFCILIPPPNVTGKLHIGHALQSTLQDLLVRWRRMHGENALWLPGTDHAGIATQLMVERQLETEGTSRIELGREHFLERMWQWKEQYHSNIRDQLEVLGASCDWSRERFTLDDELSRAVREAFVRLYREGLITRGEYMVNWSPTLRTAISDLEVEFLRVEGKLYHLAYPVVGSEERLVVATTRPETMLGDTAVAMHPDDERYQHLRGREALLPLVGRRLRIIEDEQVRQDFGTGLVKVTPAHDPNDFAMGQRHGLDSVQVIGFEGLMTDEAGEDFAGLDRFEARRRVVERLEEEGFLVRVEDHVHEVGHSQRSGEPVEPMVSTQWFCDVSAMAERALTAVKKGDLRLVPDSWDKTWEHWLTEIRPWCISRQLWWGHQIPAWYDPEGRCHVAHSRAEAAELAGTDELIQDEDVLDTWFSSGLWPLSTLGWPEQTADLETFYPTDVLITGFDIIFFWVARMVMMGLHFSDQVPFHTVHLTGLVRDANNEKMSKMKGNTVDPAELVTEYGADAVRFTLAILDSPGRDIPLDPKRMAGYRAFGNKIWNAARFALGRIDDGDAQVPLTEEEIDIDRLEAPERWILSRLSRVAFEVDRRLEAYRFDEACNHLYHFFWGELCDWYIELAKPALMGDAPRPQVAEVLLLVLDRSLRLLHPVMPHLTEELWHRLPGIDRLDLPTVALAAYPKRNTSWEDEALEAEIGVLTEVVGRLRAWRKERGLTAKESMSLFLEGGDPSSRQFLLAQAPLLERLARLDSVVDGTGPENALRDRIGGLEIAVEIDQPELKEDDKKRLESELESLEGEIARAKQRLANPQFVAKAPPQVVEGNRQRLRELEERCGVVQRELER